MVNISALDGALAKKSRAQDGSTPDGLAIGYGSTIPDVSTAGFGLDLISWINIYVYVYIANTLVTNNK